MQPSSSRSGSVDGSAGTGHRISGPCSLNQVNCNRTSTAKVICCQFSSDSKLLAFAGHDKKGGGTQVRFQPRDGHLLAVAAGDMVSILDVETNKPITSLQGHGSEVSSICWDGNGDHLALISNDLVTVWSIKSGECIQELTTDGTRLFSGIFHPSLPSVLILGGMQNMHLWEWTTNKNTQNTHVHAHEGLIASLAQSPVTGLIASASHDKTVKLWMKRFSA